MECWKLFELSELFNYHLRLRSGVNPECLLLESYLRSPVLGSDVWAGDKKQSSSSDSSPFDVW